MFKWSWLIAAELLTTGPQFQLSQNNFSVRNKSALSNDLTVCMTSSDQ